MAFLFFTSYNIYYLWKKETMNTQVNPSIIEFLSDLKDNNYREWFQENKTRYNKSVENFKQIVQALIVGINEFDNTIGPVEPSDCIFRIYRDVRFSPNKEPYKTNFGAYIANGGRKSPFAGYYFHIEPNGSFLSGGIYMAPTDVMRRIREDISDYAEDFLGIVDSPSFKKHFNFFDSDKLKKLPRGFESGSKVDEFLKLKNISPFTQLSNEDMLSPNILEYSLNTYKEMQPLISFLNRSIK
ncbi:MAG: DUF2461 domain-containing protein [Bacteroidales bacterium]